MCYGAFGGSCKHFNVLVFLFGGYLVEKNIHGYLQSVENLKVSKPPAATLLNQTGT